MVKQGQKGERKGRFKRISNGGEHEEPSIAEYKTPAKKVSKDQRGKAMYR